MRLDFFKTLVRKIISGRILKILLPTFLFLVATFNTFYGGKLASFYWSLVALYWIFRVVEQIF